MGTIALDRNLLAGSVNAYAPTGCDCAPSLVAATASLFGAFDGSAPKFSNIETKLAPARVTERGR